MQSWTLVFGLQKGTRAEVGIESNSKSLHDWRDYYAYQEVQGSGTLRRRFAKVQLLRMLSYIMVVLSTLYPQHITLVFMLFPLKVTVFAYWGCHNKLTTR